MKKEMKNNKAGKLKQMLYSKKSRAFCIFTAAAFAITALSVTDFKIPALEAQAASEEAADVSTLGMAEDGALEDGASAMVEETIEDEDMPSEEETEDEDDAEEDDWEEDDEDETDAPSEETPDATQGSTAPTTQTGGKMKLPVKIYEWLEGEGGADYYLSQHLEMEAFFTADDSAAVLKIPRNSDYFWADGVTMDYEKQYVKQSGWAAQTLEDGYSVDCLVYVEGLSDAKVSGTLTIPVPAGCEASTAKYAAYGSTSYAPVSAYTDGSVTLPYTYDPAADHYADFASTSTANYVVVEFVGKKAAQPYKVLEGADAKWTKGSGNGMTIRVDGVFEKFQSLKIDGNVVDAANYDVKSGSTIITLKNSYLKTLKNGAHELTVVYTDGEISTHFTIEDAVSNPKTGDSTPVMAWLLLAGFSVTLIFFSRKRAFAK